MPTMGERSEGQAAVEYVLVLVLFTGVALEGWRLLYPAISHIYQQFTNRRAEVNGMRP
jgi:hypothetical protein